jgi:hypothetical protein
MVTFRPLLRRIIALRFKGVAGYLQSDTCLDELARALGVAPGGEFPEEFQALFAIRIAQHEEEPVGESPSADLLDQFVPPRKPNEGRQPGRPKLRSSAALP